MAKNVIKGMTLSDGTTEFDVENLSNEALKKISLIDSDTGAPNPLATSVNNLICGTNTLPATGTYGLKNTDIKARKSVRLWPGIDDSSAAEIDLMGDGAYDAGVAVEDIKQVHVKAMISKDIVGTSKNKTIRLKQSCSELELNNKNSTGKNESTSDAGDFDIKVKHDDEFQNLRLKARSLDIRAIANDLTGGQGGGITAQIASCDSSMKENKFKVETSRKKDVFDGLPDGTTGKTITDYYNTEGGTGIEIMTLNSQFESLGAAEIRRLANSTVFAVTRGTLETTSDKTDYPTQSDDSKDIKSESQCAVKFIDIINAAIYLKATGNIPSDGSFVQAVDVTLNLTGVTSDNTKAIALKSSNYECTLTASSGTITTTVTIGGVDCTTDCWDSSTGKVTIAAASLTGAVVITATAA